METPACPCERRRIAAAKRQDPSIARPGAQDASQSVPSAHHRRRPFLGALHHADASSTTLHGPAAAIPNGDASLTPLARIPSEAASVGSLYRNNALFARLVAGQESEQGEAPPQYDQVVALESLHGTGPGAMQSATADVVPAQG